MFSRSKDARLRQIMLGVALLLILTGISDTQAQTGAEYVYDERGRLIAVIDQTGETAVYTYDAVGNLLSISRRSSAVASIINFSPKEGPVGTEVTIYGTGFSATANQNTVTFNDTNAKVTSATANKLIVTVRTGTTSGVVRVTSPAGTSTSSTPFTIIPGIIVSPAVSRVLTGGSGIQFTAAITSLSGDQSITWSVDGISGGSNEVGTISTAGYYTVPAQPAAHIIRATSVAIPTLFGEAQVAIISPETVQGVFAQSVAVSRGVSTGTITTGVNPVSVRRGLVGGYLPMSAQVAVRYGSGPGFGTAQSRSVAVRYGSAPGAGKAQSPFVSITRGPNITTVAPGSAARGTNIVLTVSGANLNGATALNFIDSNGQIDANVVASNISVNGAGTTLTATINIIGSAALGRRIVVIATPNGGTITNDLSGNTINIIP